MQLFKSVIYIIHSCEVLVRKLRQQIERKSQNLKIRVTYTPTKLGSKFVVKDKTKDESLHNVTYHVSCGNRKCKSCYVGQTKCRIIKRTLQHNSRDNASHVLIHSKTTKHRRVSMKNVKILGRRYKSDFKRRISESLFIHKTVQIRPEQAKRCFQAETLQLLVLYILTKDCLVHIRTLPIQLKYSE